MDENTQPDSGTPEVEPTPEPTVEAPTQTMAPAETAAADPTPGWAEDKFKRNTVVGGAAVAGAVVALVGASLFGGDGRGERVERVDFRGGPPGMQGGGMQGGPGMQQGGPGMQGGQQRGPGYYHQDQQDQSDQKK